MAKQYKTGLVISGDASGGIRAVRATEQELGKLNKGFDRGSQRARTFAQSSGGVSKEMAVLRRAAAPLAGILAGMFAANTMKSQINFADQLQKTNLRIGASTEALSQYNYVAKLSGVEFGQLATAWQRQTRRIAQAAKGTGEAQQALEDLNLSAKGLSRLAPEQQFERIAQAMNGVADEAEKVALAQKVWDSEGVKLLQIVNQGADAISAMRAEAESLGLTISQQTAEDMAGFNDEMDRFSFAAKGLSQSLLSAVIPALSQAMQSVNGFVGALRSDELEGVARTLNITAGAAAGVATAYVTMRGALLAATAAQWALNTAVKANPLMLLASAAATVAGALLTTRDSMSEVERQADQTAQEVRSLAQGFQLLTEKQQENARVKVMSNLAEWRLEAASVGAEIQKLGALAEQSGQLSEHGGALEIITPEQMARGRQAKEELSALMTQIGAGTETLAEMDKIVEEMGGSGGSLPQLGGAATSASKGVAKASRESGKAAKTAREHASALKSLQQQMDPLLADHETYIERIDTLDIALTAGTITQLEYAEAVQWSAQQYTDAASGADDYAARVKSLVGSYDSQAQKAKQLGQALADINDAYRNGAIEGPQYERMVQNVLDEMAALADESDPLADDMAKSWEEAAKRIDETFADAFTGAFDSFDDFADQLLDGFKRLLGELAYQATLKPIVVQMTGQMGGIMGGSQSGGGIMGAIGGGQSGGGGLGSIFSAGKNLLTEGLGNVSWGGVGTAGSTQIVNGVEVVDLAGSGGFEFLGGSTANFGGMTGIASLGAGMVGSKVGTLIADSFTDRIANSNYGSMAGGAIGTFFGGPIGAGIGSAIGSVVDKLFGSKEPDPRAYYTSGDDINWGTYGSPFGEWGWHISELGDEGARDRLGKIGESLTQIDIALAGVMTGEQVDGAIDRMREFNAATGDSLGDLEGMSRRRLTAIVDGVTDYTDRLLDENKGVQGLAASAANVIQLTNALGEFNQQVQSDVAASLDASGNVGTQSESLILALNSLEMLKQGVAQLGLTFDVSAEGAIHSAYALQELAGGVQNLATIQQGYYQSVYSETERLSRQQSDFAYALMGVTDSVPTTVEGLRALVEAQDLNTESGRELALQLMQLAPAFAENVEAVERAISQQYQDSLGRQADDEGLSYWMDEVVSGSLSLEQALSLISSATDEVGEAAKEAADNTALLAQQRQLEIQEQRLLGDESGALARERNAELDSMDESLHSLQARIWALRDSAAAEKEAAAAAQEAANVAREVANERYSLETQMLQLQGDAAELRRRELDQLDPSNRTLQQRIWALQDEQERSSVAEQKLQHVSNALNTVTTVSTGTSDALAELQAQLSSAQSAAQSAWDTYRSQQLSMEMTLLEMVGDEAAVLAEQRERELEAIEPALRGMQERIWALQDEAAAQEETTQAVADYVGALASARDSLESTLGSIAEWIDAQNATGGSPTDNLAASHEQFVEQLALARAGDRDALQGITTYADRLLSSNSDMFASSVQGQANRDKVLSALEGLPDVVSAEQFIADEIKAALKEQTSDLSGGLPAGIAISLKSLFSDIDLDANSLIDWDEFYGAFEGLATDRQLKALFDGIDLDDNGIISAVEAGEAATNAVRDNTEDSGKSLAEQALDQISELAKIDSSMTSLAIGMVNMKGSIVGLVEAISQLADIQQKEIRQAQFDSIIRDTMQHAVDSARFRTERNPTASGKSIAQHIGSKRVDDWDRTFGDINVTEDWLKAHPDFVKHWDHLNVNGEQVPIYVHVPSHDAGVAEWERLTGEVYDHITFTGSSTGPMAGDEDYLLNGAAVGSSGMADSAGGDENLAGTIVEITKGGAERTAVVFNDLLLGLEAFEGSLASTLNNSIRTAQSGFTGALDIEGFGDEVGVMTTALDDFNSGLHALVRQISTSLDFDTTDLEKAIYQSAGWKLETRNEQGYNANVGEFWVKSQGFGSETLIPYDGSHADGLDYVPFDGYMAELHKGETVLTAADSKMLRNMPALPPLLGGGDVIEVLQDLRREVAELRKENAELQGEGNRHAAASVAVQQTGFQRQIAEQQKGNRSLDEMSSGARLEASR